MTDVAMTVFFLSLLACPTAGDNSCAESAKQRFEVSFMRTNCDMLKSDVKESNDKLIECIKKTEFIIEARQDGNVVYKVSAEGIPLEVLAEMWRTAIVAIAPYRIPPATNETP